MRRNVKVVTQEVEVAQTTNGESVDVREGKGLSVAHYATVTTPSAVDIDADTEVDVDEDTLTVTGHGFATGLKGQLTSSGTLPAGLSTSTDYFVIVVDEDTIQLASSLANANAGTAVDITNVGTAASTHTFTPTALAGASVKLQASLDNEVFFDITNTSNNITVTANFFLLDKVDPMYNYVRAVHTLTAGQLNLITKIVVKDDK